MAIVTSMATSFKVELFSAGHCFNATVNPTGTLTSGSATVTAVSSMSGVAVGMAVTAAANVSASTYVAAVLSSTSFVMSQVATGAASGTTLTVAGDVFKMALIKPGMAGTYGAANVNYTDITGNSDETSGTGYTAGGTTLTNVSAVSGGTTAYINFSPNPSWTSATFSTAGCMIYNSSIRDGGTSGTNTSGAGRCCSVHDFGGSQTVSVGTFTVLMPNPSSTTAILRIA